MISLDQIKAPISKEYEEFKNLFNTVFQTEIEQFTNNFSDQFQANEELLRRVVKYVSNKQGKHMRPIFSILCAKLCGSVNDVTYRVATSYELLHTASLIHDDVVDNTLQRRGQPSVNAVFDNRTAVLVGDYLLSKSMSFISSTKNSVLFDQLANLGLMLSRGELLQLQHAYDIPTEEEYIDIIRKKTAILFIASAQAAAISANANNTQYEALTRFAEFLGICFQIKDDILDYSPKANIGKPTLNDIREGKITLPLQHALKISSKHHADLILNAVKEGNFSEEFFYNIGLLVARNGGIEYAEKRMYYYKEEAIKALQCFPESETKVALINLLSLVLERDY